MSDNKLSVFAKNATESATEVSSPSVGTVFTDAAWAVLTSTSGNVPYEGEIRGKASSQRFNTALRQATFGSYLLGELLVARYGSILTNDISTENIDAITDELTAIMIPSNKRFLLDGEVSVAKLDSSVTAGSFPNMSVGKVVGGISESSNIGNHGTLSQIFVANSSTVKQANITNTTSFTNNNWTTVNTSSDSSGNIFVTLPLIGNTKNYELILNIDDTESIYLGLVLALSTIGKTNIASVIDYSISDVTIFGVMANATLQSNGVLINLVTVLNTGVTGYLPGGKTYTLSYRVIA